MKNIILILCLLTGHVTSAQIQWQEVSTPTMKDLNVIQFVSNDIGYVGGDSVLLKTLDGGITWNNLSLDSFPPNINTSLNFLDMHWFDQSHGIVMLGWSGSFETFDGGVIWSPVNASNGFCQKSTIYFQDEEQGFIGGSGCFFGHYIERYDGSEWVGTNINTFGDAGDNWVSSIEFMNSDTGFAGTNAGVLLRTIDSGFSWDTISSIAGDSAITDFAFYGSDSIRATHRNNNQWGAMLSVDGGETWTWDSEIATFFYPSMNAIHINGNGTTFIGGEASFGDGGLIFDNSGQFWNWGSIGQPINDITSHSDSITLLVADSGMIYVNVVPSTIGVEELNSVQFQLAPNPTTDRIQLSGFDESIQSFSILDIAGKLVRQTIGTFGSKFEIEVSDLPQGSYLIQVQSETGIGVKRFVKL